METSDRDAGVESVSSMLVEVFASTSHESIGGLESPKASFASLVDQYEGDEPELLPVGSGSESENSSLVDGEHDDIRTIERNPSNLEVQVVRANNVVSADDDGIYDCLTDQFSNMFCPADNQEILQISAAETQKSEDLHARASCTELQIQDILDAANPDTFSPFQFLLAPCQEMGEQKLTPQNRSIWRKRKSNYIERLWNSWYPENEIPIQRSLSKPSASTPSVMDLQAGLFYDSDPEQEFKDRKRRRESLEKKPKYKEKRPSPILTSFPSEPSFGTINPCPPTPRNANRYAFDFVPRTDGYATPPGSMDAPSFFESPIGMTEFDLVNDDGGEVMKRFVQEATNSRIKLVWHRYSVDDHKNGSRSPLLQAPVAVTGAFEVGAHLEQTVVQPKFTWSPTYEPNLVKRKIRLSGGEPDHIELLSIVRVTEPEELDRSLFPFARLNRTCCIQTNDERYPYLVFEASSTEERDWLVKALKAIVARLASIIIMRDENMLMEFFSPFSALASFVDEEADSYQCSYDYPEGSAPPVLEENGDLHFLSHDLSGQNNDPSCFGNELSAGKIATPGMSMSYSC